MAKKDESVAAEFASRGTPIDEDGARVHERAVELLGRLGVDSPSEDSYAAAIDLLGGGSGGLVDADLENRLEAGEALDALVQYDLRASGLADDEEAYLRRMRELQNEHGLDY